MKKTSAFQNSLIWFGAAVSIAEVLTGTYFAPLGFTKGLLAILVGWVIFNSAGVGQAGGYLSAMFGAGRTFTETGVSARFLLGQYKVDFLLAVLFCLPVPHCLRLLYERRAWFAAVCDAALLGVFALSVTAIVNSSFNPFIYFRF